MVVAGLVTPRPGRVRAGQGVHLGAARREVLDGRGDPAHEQHLRTLRRPDAQLGVGDALGHGLVDQRLEVRRDVRRVADQVHGAQQRGRDLAQLGHLPAGADAARVALEVPGDGADRRRQLAARLRLVAAVGEQDRVLLGHLRHLGEDRVRQPQPGAHRGAAGGPHVRDGALGLLAGARLHLHDRDRRVRVREGAVGHVAAADDREPGAVGDLVDRHLRRVLGGVDVRAAHRPRGVDDDDLRDAPAARRGGPRAGAGHRDDRVHVRGTVGEELVLEHLGAEVGHCGSSIRLRSVPGRPGRPRRCGQYRRVPRRGPAPR